MKITDTPEAQLEMACGIVERHCRSIGKDCQVIFTNNGVEIAPLSWAGSETGKNLFEALTHAIEAENT